MGERSVSQDWRQSWLIWIAALASAVFLVLWWAVDENFVWGFVLFGLLTAVVWMRETNDWPRSPLAWLVWLIGIVFLVLWLAVDENFRWPCFVFLFLAIVMRAREAHTPRREHDQSLQSH